MNNWWRVWKRDYLTSLRQCHNLLGRESSMKKGDVVLVKDENQGRSDWRLERIKSINESEDGQVKSALLTVTSKGGRHGNINPWRS